jgi:GNAT superfamily N-acetyltransferase
LIKGLKIVDVDKDRFDDLIYLCSGEYVDDPVHRVGIEAKRRWYFDLLREGPCAKVAYLKGKAVAQVLYWPERLDPRVKEKRPGVLFLHCIYNPVKRAQRCGIAKLLMKRLIREVKAGGAGLKGPCRFIWTKPFDTGEMLSLPDFYEKMGFKRWEGETVDITHYARETTMFLEVNDRFQPLSPLRPYHEVGEDMGRAKIFYSPVCQYGYHFAHRTAQLIKKVIPGIQVDMINSWEHPEEWIRRGGETVMVNSKPIRKPFWNEREFLDEVKIAVK